jgi:hypothetical protein
MFYRAGHLQSIWRLLPQAARATVSPLLDSTLDALEKSVQFAKGELR